MKNHICARLAGLIDIGLRRKDQQDAGIVYGRVFDQQYAIPTIIVEDGMLLGVLDGMGGTAAGGYASRQGAHYIIDSMAKAGPPEHHELLATRLEHCLKAANALLLRDVEVDQMKEGMGTTATVAALYEDHLYLAQVGDSRGYILRGNRLVRVTHDHSFIQKWIDEGKITPEQARINPHRNRITRAVGSKPELKVDISYVHLRRGDTLLLCSDGLWEMMRDEEISGVLRSIPDPFGACQVLISRANANGGDDNITVVIAKFDGDGLLPATAGDVTCLRYVKLE
jgi:PPM family protein phosphatase